LLLPGLIFSVFRRLGVGRQVSWWWMWLLASGWCYVLQASTTHNDSIATIYVLAAVDLALRSKETNRVGDLWLSLLAIALATAIKQTNIPLVLLWLVAAAPSLGLALKHRLSSLGIALLAALVSTLPTTVLNVQETGTWTGMPLMNWEPSTIGSWQLY